MDGVASTPISLVPVRPEKTAAIFVHGLWLTGAESLLMRRRVTANHGIECHSFSYPTVGRSMNEIIERLTSFVARIDADHVHFVGHSLGGLVLYRYFESVRQGAPGRVVFLGSPTVKSKTAERVGKMPLLSSLVGRMVIDELVTPSGAREWRFERELGLIAGTRPLGLGRFFARFDEDCDGTIGVSETKLPGHKAHVTLPVSHMGMLASAAVARHVGTFLVHGKFSQD
jgi:pimeloyl-ACP methyl ester carboxylesterase